MKKLYYNHAQVTSAVQTIIRDMALDKWSPDIIVGLSRGGLIPAVMLSHYLHCPMRTLNLSFRDANEQATSDLELAELATSQKILIVDDINDTGKTLNWIKEDWSTNFPDYDNWNTWHHTVKFAVLVNNSASEFKNVDYSAFEINKDEDPSWVVFHPWEEWWISDK